MIAINDYLNGILMDFQAYLNEGHPLCDLKSLNYDQGRVPDYGALHVQQYYLLRYAYGYAFEYKLMYRTLLGWFPFQREISVTSIGCGAMLDFWALVRVLEQQNQAGISVRYTGIDLIAWNYQFQQRSHDRVAFLRADAVETLAQCGQLESDIYCFPKSISEFSDYDFKRLCDIFQGTPIKKDRFHLLVSVRSDENSQKRDIQRVQQLRGAIVQNGFRDDDVRNVFYQSSTQDQKIRSGDSDFQHPSDVIDCLRELNTRCSGYQDDRGNCRTDCQDRLTRWPILGQKQAHFGIFTFERTQS